MTDSSSDEFDPTAPDQREIGREMVGDSTGLGSVMAHAYRGEIDRMGTWRQRLDETTKWAVTLMAAILTWAFSSTDNPHYLLLVGIVVVTIFLGIEARRYRDYDVFRSRARVIQENLLANALDPSQGIESHDWRAELSRDYRRPTLKVSLYEALANRLRRVYLCSAQCPVGRMGLQDYSVRGAPRLAENRWNRPYPRYCCGCRCGCVLRRTAGRHLLAPRAPCQG